VTDLLSKGLEAESRIRFQDKHSPSRMEKFGELDEDGRIILKQIFNGKI
jgi:hypothetical protein